AAPCEVPSSDYPTIQAAVNDATCAAINVAAGTFTEHVVINRDVTIRGEDQATTIVDGSASGTVFTITSGTVRIKNVTIQNGLLLGSGGGINNGGILTVRNSTISGNTAFRDGGGIDNGGTVTLT